MLAVAEHYYHCGGASPLNEQNRQLIRQLTFQLAEHGPRLPVYWGNRNWHPLLPDTMAQMAADGIRRAVAFFTSAYSSYSGCRQYRENILAAQTAVEQSTLPDPPDPGVAPAVQAPPPQVDKIRAFFNHPRFIAAQVDRLTAALERIAPANRSAAGLIFTAHSIPVAMAASCQYADQLQETARLIAAAVGHGDWQLAYQSRSGPPSQPWLKPDIADVLKDSAAAGKRDVVVAPIGFLSDHMEVIYDLDIEAQQVAGRLGLNLVRAGTVYGHGEFIGMVRDLIAERVSGLPDRPTVGKLGPVPDICPAGCCLPAQRPPQ